jgi:hypothetical protein
VKVANLLGVASDANLVLPFPLLALEGLLLGKCRACVSSQKDGHTKAKRFGMLPEIWLEENQGFDRIDYVQCTIAAREKSKLACSLVT